MSYAGYDFYRNTYLGKLIEDSEVFARLAKRASEHLDFLTFHRLNQSEVDESVRLATCSMAEVLFWEEKRKTEHDGREVSSESNDGYSVTFADTNASDAGLITKRDLYLAAYKYLSGSGLMDFGV